MKKKGTTLIELMAAMAIFAIMMTGIYYIFDVANKMFYNNKIHLTIQMASNDSLNNISRNIQKSNVMIINPADPVVPTGIISAGETFVCYLEVSESGGQCKYLYWTTKPDSDGICQLKCYKQPNGAASKTLIVSKYIKDVKVSLLGTREYYVSVTSRFVHYGNHDLNLANSVAMRDR